ncbi:hypothetical protein HPP92_010549 [Vanilla planifolia]|uniref:Uncharacterized protein n=1 Tax=Vanilla planifolia TaxID=51239 RepID=A0A835QU52_VANPL|nr:hypothetical protein HPP92_010549 [Vanilla planifolia]
MVDYENTEVLKSQTRESEDMDTNTIAFANAAAAHSPFVRALLALQSTAANLFSGEIGHCSISRLKVLASPSSPPSLRSPCSSREISRLAASINSEVNSWIHDESLPQLISLLRFPPSFDEEKTIRLLLVFECIVSRGFDRGLQDAILRHGVLPAVESVLTSQDASDRVRDLCSEVVLSLVLFNKDVFVGEVMMGPAVGCLVSMGSAAALYSLAGLIAAIRSPLVDELLAKGDIPRILAFLTSPNPEIRVLALDCVVELGYFGRKEAVDAMLEAGVVKRLLELQHSDLGLGDEIREKERTEGLRQREKRAFKLEVLRRAREASVNEAEAATVTGEILWGSVSW